MVMIERRRKALQRRSHTQFRHERGALCSLPSSFSRSAQPSRLRRRMFRLKPYHSGKPTCLIRPIDRTVVRRPYYRGCRQATAEASVRRQKIKQHYSFLYFLSFHFSMPPATAEGTVRPFQRSLPIRKIAVAVARTRPSVSRSCPDVKHRFPFKCSIFPVPNIFPGTAGRIKRVFDSTVTAILFGGSVA
ncbi:hypothetical protein SMETH9_35060 [Serratia marcescens]|nr:hypothetical protein SMETH9_35060 [Serratia marcescens]